MKRRLRINRELMFEESWITKFDVKANIFLVYEAVLKVSNAQSQHYKSTFAKEDIITVYMTQANKCLVGKKMELLSSHCHVTCNLPDDWKLTVMTDLCSAMRDKKLRPTPPVYPNSTWFRKLLGNSKPVLH